MRSYLVLAQTVAPELARSSSGDSWTSGHVRKSGRQSHRDVDDRQARVAAVMPAANLDLRMKLVSCSDRNRLRQDLALPRLLGCQAMQGTVRAVFVEPSAEVIQPALDASLREARQDQLPPATEGAKPSKRPARISVLCGPATSTTLYSTRSD